ncbi:hypothetical protein BN440_1088 [Erwinia amylovora MR1]|nr:hypothetical protein BN440_1088 [Erwinia amylovora MR1]
MHNATSIQAGKNQRQRKATSWSLPGGVAGFVAWWIALAIPLMMYGSGTLFLFFFIPGLSFLRYYRFRCWQALSSARCCAVM